MSRNVEKIEIRVRCDHYASRLLSMHEICELTGATEPMLKRMLDEGILHFVHDDYFEPEAILEVEKYLRLHNDLGVNWSGIAIIGELIDRLERRALFEDSSPRDVDFEDL